MSVSLQGLASVFWEGTGQSPTLSNNRTLVSVCGIQSTLVIEILCCVLASYNDVHLSFFKKEVCANYMIMKQTRSLILNFKSCGNNVLGSLLG